MRKRILAAKIALAVALLQGLCQATDCVLTALLYCGAVGYGAVGAHLMRDETFAELASPEGRPFRATCQPKGVTYKDNHQKGGAMPRLSAVGISGLQAG